MKVAFFSNSVVSGREYMLSTFLGNRSKTDWIWRTKACLLPLNSEGSGEIWGSMCIHEGTEASFLRKAQASLRTPKSPLLTGLALLDFSIEVV